MALDSELINLKSAGIYRFERDKSEISNETTTVSNLRLVVGFSKTGPFNTVKLVTSTAQFIKLYGNIDRSLEKRGSYFHRSALVTLSAGPILCLNLMNLDPDQDQVMEKSLSVSSGETNKNIITLPLTTLYNTDKFWYTSDEAYLDALDKYLDVNNIADPDGEDWNESILHFSNVGKKPVSVLVKKASDYSCKNYQLTLNDWYGEGNVPEYLNGTSYVSDYMVEVYVIGGDFGPALKTSDVVSAIDLDDDDDNGKGDVLTKYSVDTKDGTESAYKRFSSDVIYQSYFDENGFIRGTNDSNLTKFLNLPSVDLRAKYVGSLIPNFVDKLGKNIWIQKLINDDTDTIGLLCAENTELIEEVADEETGADFINEKIDLLGHNVFKTVLDNSGSTTYPDMSFDFLSYKFDYTYKGQQVKASIDSESIVLTRPDNANNDQDVNSYMYPFAWVGDDGEIYYSDSTYLTVGALLYNDPGELSESESEIPKSVGKVSEIVEDNKPLITEFKYLDTSDLYTDTKLTNAYTPRDNEVILNVNANVVVGDSLLSDYYYGDEDTEGSVNRYSRVTRVKEVKNIYCADETGKSKYTKCGIRVICADKISKTRGEDDNMVVKITPIDKLADHLQWICLKGFQVRKDAMPDGTNDRQNEILDMIREEPEYTSTTSNLFKTLIDRDYVQWRYLVDTFGLGLESECKNVYTKLCKSRMSGLALVNCPSQMDFKKSIDPSFTNKLGSVQAEYIANGGNSDDNPSFLFSLPSIDNGASWGAYYYPYLRITDLGAAKSVPPAAYVSNLYIQKYSRGFAWSIVAGQKRGVISGNQVVGVEATLIHDNRDYLEPVGINSIIWEQGIGVEVYANKTAKQTPQSALSSAHVREAAIYIQDGVESILRKYVFEFNTAQTRLEIKTLVDEFLNSMKNNGGLYDFRTVMDTTNNTSEVIDNNKGVIDIYVEIVRGLEVIAQRLTILKTGAIAAGGFDE